MEMRLRPATPVDTAALVALINRQQPESTTLTTWTAADDRRSPARPFLRLVAETPAGELAGYAEAASGVAMAPGHYALRVCVDAPWRAQGLGHLLHGSVAAWAEVQGASCLTASVTDSDPSALTWAQREGYQPVGQVLESELDLTAWEAPGHAPPLLDGMRLTTLAAEMQSPDQPALTGGRGSGDHAERTLRRFHAFCVQGEQDAPGRGPRTPAYDIWRREILPTLNPAGVVLAVAEDDQWAAMSQVDGSGDTLYHALTVVHHGYRGQRLALAVKVQALTYAKSLGARAIRTHNHEVNGPMLAINRRLGFRPLHGLIQLDCPVR